MKRWRYWAAALLVVTLAGCSNVAPNQPGTVSSDLAELREKYQLADCPASTPESTSIPDGLPATTLACLGEEAVVNLAGLERQPMLINFWAQWCGPCRAEAPLLSKAAAELTDVQLLGVNYDDPRPDWAIEFAGLAGWTYPQVTDPDKSLQAELGVPGLPATFFVRTDGTIAGVHAGAFDSYEQLLSLKQKYLGAP